MNRYISEEEMDRMWKRAIRREWLNKIADFMWVYDKIGRERKR